MKDSDIMVDLEGSSPQVDWGGNVVFNFTYAYVFMAMKSMFDPDIPNNDGCTAPIAMKAPPGSVVNCRFPAAVQFKEKLQALKREIERADAHFKFLILGAGACHLCDPCNYIDGKPCRHPKDAVVSLEAGGIDVMQRGDICSQVVTLDKSFLTERISTISMNKMSEVDDGLRLVLNL